MPLEPKMPLKQKRTLIISIISFFILLFIALITYEAKAHLTGYWQRGVIVCCDQFGYTYRTPDRFIPTRHYHQRYGPRPYYRGPRQPLFEFRFNFGGNSHQGLGRYQQRRPGRGHNRGHGGH